MIELSDFPKLHCPFVRRTYEVDKDDWRKHGRELQLRKPEVYLVTPEINPGYEWVFDDPDTIAVEKLDGNNVKLLTENGRLISLYNRKNPIDPLNLFISKGRTAIIEGVFRAVAKGYVEKAGEQCGEVIGPHINQNIYKLDHCIWYPFEKAVKHLSYRSFHEHERSFETWSSWFKEYLISRFAAKMGNRIMAEGLVFYNLKRKEQNKIYRAKLRRDMYDWFYSDRIEINETEGHESLDKLRTLRPSKGKRKGHPH